MLTPFPSNGPLGPVAEGALGPAPAPALALPFRSILGFCALAADRYLPRLAPRRSPGLSEGPQDRSVQSLTQHSPGELGAESLLRPFPARQ